MAALVMKEVFPSKGVEFGEDVALPNPELAADPDRVGTGVRRDGGQDPGGEVRHRAGMGGWHAPHTVRPSAVRQSDGRWEG